MSILQFNSEAGLREAEQPGVGRQKKTKLKRAKLSAVETSTAPVLKSSTDLDETLPSAQVTTFAENAARRIQLKSKHDPLVDARTVFVGNVALTVTKKVRRH